ncbi:hypothetical protein A5844_000213, partial [Enterococcus sp. 10A9_DIV0425]
LIIVVSFLIISSKTANILNVFRPYYYRLLSL